MQVPHHSVGRGDVPVDASAIKRGEQIQSVYEDKLRI